MVAGDRGRVRAKDLADLCEGGGGVNACKIVADHDLKILNLSAGVKPGQHLGVFFRHAEGGDGYGFSGFLFEDYGNDFSQHKVAADYRVGGVAWVW